MVHDKQPEYENLFRASPEDKSLSIDGGRRGFFKSEKCPLSNYYYCDHKCHPMTFYAVAGDDDDDDDDDVVDDDDLLYDEPQLRYGARQAFCSFEGQEDGVGCLLSENCLAKKCLAAPCSHRTDGMSYERQLGVDSGRRRTP